MWSSFFTRHHEQKQLQRGKGLFKSITEGNQGMDLESESEPEAMKEQCLLTCSLCLAQSAFLYKLGPLSQGRHSPQCSETTNITH